MPKQGQLNLRELRQTAVKVLQTPMSWLHTMQDPFVNVWVTAVCGRRQCEIVMRQEIQRLMGEISAAAGPGVGVGANPNANTMQLMPCNVCGATSGTTKCGRCRVVAYCGRDH